MEEGGEEVLFSTLTLDTLTLGGCNKVGSVRDHSSSVSYEDGGVREGR